VVFGRRRLDYQFSFLILKKRDRLEFER